MGYYEWDDDDLTPGNKEEGGWHQNLYDSDGRLKGNARFVPFTDSEDNHIPSGEHVYVTSEERRLSEEDGRVAEFIGIILASMLEYGWRKATPHIRSWWTAKARPFIAKHKSRMRFSRRSRDTLDECDETARCSDQPERETPVQSGEQQDNSIMSRPEAQARLLAALAARYFSDEQVRFVSEARILDLPDGAAPQQLLREIPQDKLVAIVEGMARNPVMLDDASLANLASVLKPHRDLSSTPPTQ